MKAIIQNAYGSPQDVLELREVKKPVPGNDDVLVRVHAASVHPDIWHVVTGRGGGISREERQSIPVR